MEIKMISIPIDRFNELEDLKEKYEKLSEIHRNVCADYHAVLRRLYNEPNHYYNSTSKRSRKSNSIDSTCIE
jgi:hypothetical protein